MRVSLGWAPAVVYVAFGEPAMVGLRKTYPDRIRIRWEEFRAWAAGVEDAPDEQERQTRLEEGLAFFRNRQD